jgi:hypothetical protein
MPHVRQSVRGTKTMGEAQQSLLLHRLADDPVPESQSLSGAQRDA